MSTKKHMIPLLPSLFFAVVLTPVLAPALAPSLRRAPGENTPNRGEEQTKDKRTPAEKVLDKKAEDLAFLHVDVYDGSGKILHDQTVLVRKGKILDIGKKLRIPPSMKRLEGGVLLPGLVHAALPASIAPQTRRPSMPSPHRGRRRRLPSRMGGRSSSFAFTPTAKASAMVNPKNTLWRDLLRGGVTTAAVYPSRTGIVGQESVLRIGIADPKAWVLKDGLFLWLRMGYGSNAHKAIKTTFDKAIKLIEARKAKSKTPSTTKAKSPAKATPAAKGIKSSKPAPKPNPKPAPKPAPKPKPTPKPTPKPSPKPSPKPAPKPGQSPKKASPTAQAPKKKAPPKEDPNLVVLAEVLEGKRPLVLQIGGLGELLQALRALSPYLEKYKISLTVVHKYARLSKETLDQVLPLLQRYKARVILPVELAFAEDSQWFTCPAKRLLDAGIPLSLVPGDNPASLASLSFRMSRFRQAGIPLAKLVALCTGEVAKALGVDKEVGLIQKGRAANLIHLKGTPFGPATKRLGIYFEGRRVHFIPSPHDQD